MPNQNDDIRKEFREFVKLNEGLKHVIKIIRLLGAKKATLTLTVSYDDETKRNFGIPLYDDLKK